LIQLIAKSPVLKNPTLFATWIRGSLDSLVVLNRETLRAYPKTPRVYHSGVVYREEPAGVESLVDIAELYLQGWGDCAHLGAARLAELQERDGELDAELRITWVIPNANDYPEGSRERRRLLAGGKPKRTFHVQIRRGGAPATAGKIECPSEALGMQHARYLPPHSNDELAHVDEVSGRPWWVVPRIWRQAEKAVRPWEGRAGYGAVMHVYRKMLTHEQRAGRI
jgi:hypothetical protein